MKTQSNHLVLKKESVVELNKEQLQNVNGGTATLIGTTSLIALTLVTK
ncbi:class IIb bacteriocin, lactobin A/cerein 7B family [Lacinutrix sp. Hel_I_90]|nr:class IIb bacteriocin, lactobin A/cerein 7B family [Lacinutrix sp. Hel_I_90]